MKRIILSLFLVVITTISWAQKIEAMDFVYNSGISTALNKLKWNVSQENTPNPHGGTNLIVTYYTYKNSKIYKLIDLYAWISIEDPEIILNGNIHVGMSKTQFFNCFTSLKDNMDAPFVEIQNDVIKIDCCLEQTSVWIFSFQNDTLRKIQYEPYID